MNNASMLHQTIKYVSTINIRFTRYKDRSKRAFATETKRVYRLIAMEACASVARERARTSRTCAYARARMQKRTLDRPSPRAWPSVERLPLIPPFNPRHLLSETGRGERRNACVCASSRAYTHRDASRGSTEHFLPSWVTRRIICISRRHFK